MRLHLLLCSGALTLGGASAMAQVHATTASSNIEWNWYYEAHLPPDISGSIEAPLGTPTSTFTQSLGELTGESNQAGVFQASTIDTNAGAIFGVPAKSPLLNLDSDKGYTVEWIVKVINIDQPNVGGGISLAVDEDRPGVDRFWNVTFVKDVQNEYRVQLEGDQSIAAVYASVRRDVFQRIRVTVHGDTATLFVNDEMVGTMSKLRELERNAVEFGDFTSECDAEYAVDSLRVFDGGAVPPTGDQPNTNARNVP